VFKGCGLGIVLPFVWARGELLDFGWGWYRIAGQVVAVSRVGFVRDVAAPWGLGPALGSRWVRGRVTRFLVGPLGLLILRRWAECLCPVLVGWSSACWLGSCGWAVLGVAICGVLGFEGVRHVQFPWGFITRCQV
jgi:hypothetical protein